MAAKIKTSKSYQANMAKVEREYQLKLEYLKSGNMHKVTADGWASELRERAQNMRNRFEGYKGSRGDNPVAWQEINLLETRASEVENVISIVYSTKQ